MRIAWSNDLKMADHYQNVISIKPCSWPFVSILEFGFGRHFKGLHVQCSLHYPLIISIYFPNSYSLLVSFSHLAWRRSSRTSFKPHGVLPRQQAQRWYWKLVNEAGPRIHYHIAWCPGECGWSGFVLVFSWLPLGQEGRWQQFPANGAPQACI